MKPLFFFFFILLLGYPVTSISIEELIDSYDYSYSSDDIEINSISHSGYSTIPYDSIRVTLDLDISEADNYLFIADLYNNQRYVTSSKEISLPQGNNEVNIDFDPRLMLNGDYNLSLSIYKDNSVLSYGQDIYSFNFDNNEYLKPELEVTSIFHEFLDSDSDSRFESLQIDLKIDSKIEVSSPTVLFFAGENITFTTNTQVILNPGSNNIPIVIDVSEIKKRNIGKLELYQINIANYSFKENYEINNYTLSLLESTKSRIIGITKEETLDLDDDTFLDIIRLEWELDIMGSGQYTLEFSIYSVYDEFVGIISQKGQFNEGINNLNTEIDGKIFYSKKINGPYKITSIKLLKDETLIHGLNEDYITREYYFSDFEAIPLPDLYLEVNEEGEMDEVRVSNIGNAPAFNIFIEAYEELSTKVSKHLTILPAQMDLIFYINKSENGSVVIIVDGDNIVEESNEQNNIYPNQIDNNKEEKIQSQQTSGSSSSKVSPLNVICEEHWVCDEWSECYKARSTRYCYDINNCATDFDKPKEETNCTATNEDSDKLKGEKTSKADIPYSKTDKSNPLNPIQSITGMVPLTQSQTHTLTGITITSTILISGISIYFLFIKKLFV